MAGRLVDIIQVRLKILSLLYSSGQKSSCFHCVQHFFVGFPLAFRFCLPFPLDSVAKFVPYTYSDGQTVENEYTYVSCKYYS